MVLLMWHGFPSTAALNYVVFGDLFLECVGLYGLLVAVVI